MSDGFRETNVLVVSNLLSIYKGFGDLKFSQLENPHNGPSATIGELVMTLING